MKYQQFNLLLTTLSPLHIGNGQRLTSVGEYHNTGKKLMIIDKEALHKNLKDNDLLKHYYQTILDEGKETDIWKFLQEKGIDITEFNTQEYTLNADNFDATHNRFLDLFIETGGEKYIPGSSIKGVLRHYLFLYQINTNTSLKKNIERIINAKNDLKEIKKEIKKVEQEVFNEKDRFNYSDFTLFRPEDSQIIPEKDFVVEVANRQSLFENFGDLGSLRLSVAENVDVDFVLTIKESNHTQPTFKDSNIKDILNKINLVSKKFLEYEIACIKKATNPVFGTVKEDLEQLLTQITSIENEVFAIIRMGKGRSFYFNTLLPFISKTSREKIIRLLISSKVQAINEKINKGVLEGTKINIDTYIENYPQTRVLTANNQTFGWVKLSKQNSYNIIFDVNDELKKSLKNNMIESLLKKTTTLNAYYKGLKKVDFLLNGKLYEDFTLIIDRSIDINQIPKDEYITITIWQLKKTGEISQVKLLKL